MYLLGTRSQQARDHIYRADGAIVAANTSQLLLPERKSTAFLRITNNSAADLWVEIGGARATATISGGALTGFSITNGGFGYKLPPTVYLFGGGNGGNSVCPGVGLAGWPAPGDAAFVQPRQGSTTDRPGRAHAVLTADVVTSIVIDDPGSGYVAAPQVFLENNILDPFGVADPFFGSANSGILIPTHTSYEWNDTFCPTDALAIVGGTMSQAFFVAWAP